MGADLFIYKGQSELNILSSINKKDVKVVKEKNKWICFFNLRVRT